MGDLCDVPGRVALPLHSRKEESGDVKGQGGVMVRQRRWFAQGVTAVAAAALIGAPGALAATPQQIYRDLADNGRLDRTYSKSDLQRALKDASVQGYGAPTVKVRYAPRVQQALGASAAQKRPVSRRTLPFTGLDLALLAAGGASLLGIGAGLRRLGRSKA